MNHFSNYFPEDMNALLIGKNHFSRVKKVEGVYKELHGYDDKVYGDYISIEKFNYYLFTDQFSDTPYCGTDEDIYAVCKYREDGTFKHAIFSFNELDPIKN